MDLDFVRTIDFSQIQSFFFEPETLFFGLFHDLVSLDLQLVVVQCLLDSIHFSLHAGHVPSVRWKEILL